MCALALEAKYGLLAFYNCYCEDLLVCAFDLFVKLQTCVCMLSPQLTWRDMQFIVMLTARPDGLNAADWITNAVGRRGELLVGAVELCVRTCIRCWKRCSRTGYDACAVFLLCKE